ncbi:MAG TPA: protein kinase [Vicinamibacterales bacterium]|jgi:serine/threonine-protein kinase|nr:protein kinase [Vicinamibacterales bacterium]
MPLNAGTRVGAYEILSALGAGGMGEVYRARDTKLGRYVALKVIPDTLALDPDRLARFKREAQVLASLNHPHIAAIYGFEDSGETPALVLELVEGETLADRIARGAIPLGEALPMARQICEALEGAHEAGIIHRDLKPANIKVTPDGVVKVLDFGLAKLEEPAGSGQPAVGARLSEVPTITSPAMMTGVGVILGTAAYMAPEQAKGREADKRSDVWAFGCVLFEMLTGTRAFDGDDVAEVLSRVLQREPEWEALSSNVPQSIRTLLHGCLVKDRRKRIADIAAALFVLDHQTGLTATGTVSAAPLPRRPLWQRIAALTAGALVVAAVGGAAMWFVTLPSPARISRLLIAPTGAAALTISGLDRDLAITPDGSRVVYVGNRGTQLFVRALDALDAVAVFTGAPRGPFVSPDGQWIGFVDGIATLKKVALTGGPAVTLATLDGNARRGATWAPDDTIIVASIGLLRVAATGGPTTVLTRPDRAHGELNHAWPELLPGGRAVLFTIAAVTGGLDAAQVAVLDLETGTRKVLVRGGSHARFASSGHLVYAAAGTLRAVAFDLATLETRGTPVPVVRDVVTTLNTGGVDAVVASDGTLAYVLGGAIGADVRAPRTLVWVDRQGRETPIPAPPRAYLYPRLSPDGRRVAVSAADREADIWVWDLSRTTLTRATFDPRLDTYPVWTPDGHRLLFGSDRTGARNLYWQAADGTGAVERLTESPNQQNAAAVAPDGHRLLFTEVAPKTADDVMQVELDGTHRVTALVQSPFAERNGIVSPDGRWLAYEANESGRFEIYVRPFPEVNSGHWQVSTGGGTRPLWASGGQELFYASPTGALMRVGVERASSWAATTPTLLVKEGYFTIPDGTLGRTYDITPDGQRFLMIKEAGGTDQTAAPPQIIVVQHWTDELKRLVPTK